MIKKTKDKIKEHFKEVLETKTSAHSIALGVAIGTFIGIIPTPFFSVLLGVLIILIFKKTSKLGLFGSLAFWNPLTIPFTYYLSYKIGNILFGNLPVIKYNVIILDQIYNFSRRFLVGNLIVAIGFSLLCYGLTYLIIKKYKKI